MQSNALAEFGRISVRVAVTAALWLAPAMGSSARAQTPENSAASSIDLGARGGLLPTPRSTRPRSRMVRLVP